MNSSTHQLPNRAHGRHLFAPVSNIDRSVSHFGLIADGTRRWAQRRSISLPDAYILAVEKIECLSAAVFEEGTEIFSIYLLSVDNLKRDLVSLDAALKAETYMLQDLLPRIAAQWNCRMVHAGAADLLPEAFQLHLSTLCASTNHYQERTMYLCAGYDPMLEVAHAHEASLHNGLPLAANFWVPRPVDLILRTGAVSRLSNFLPLQSGYAELYFTTKLFPDTDSADIKRAYSYFNQCQRRHGL